MKEREKELYNYQLKPAPTKMPPQEYIEKYLDVDGECVFVLEDIVRDKKINTLKLSAQMVIKKSTLLNWINLIEGGEKEYDKMEAFQFGRD